MAALLGGGGACTVAKTNLDRLERVDAVAAAVEAVDMHTLLKLLPLLPSMAPVPVVRRHAAAQRELELARDDTAERGIEEHQDEPASRCMVQ